MAKFTLDAKLENDSFFIANLDLSELRLINNSDYTWLILIPKINNLIEITDLSPQDYATLGKEIRELATIIQKEFNPDKLNIATIGNIVKQLHVHIVARYKNDKTFPKPVWGNDFTPYSKEELELKTSKIAAAIRSMS